MTDVLNTNRTSKSLANRSVLRLNYAWHGCSSNHDVFTTDAIRFAITIFINSQFLQRCVPDDKNKWISQCKWLKISIYFGSGCAGRRVFGCSRLPIWCDAMLYVITLWHVVPYCVALHYILCSFSAFYTSWFLVDIMELDVTETNECKLQMVDGNRWVTVILNAFAFIVQRAGRIQMTNLFKNIYLI